MSLLERYLSHSHICQSSEWGDFKTRMGTRALCAGDAQFTLHKVPGLPFNIGYSPRVVPGEVDWENLQRSGKENRCLYVKLDVPQTKNISRIFELAGEYGANLRESRSIFATETVLLDLAPSEGDLLAAMKTKTRYNINLAWRRGVIVEEREDADALESFLTLQRATSNRQGFYTHPDSYYRTAWETLHPEGMAHLLVASLPTGEAIAAWMLFRYGDILYYPYGGSDYKYRSFMASNLLMWEAMKLGKRLSCSVLDAWGATSDRSNPWWGFTRFKLGFGGELVKLPGSYDFVIEPALYPLITAADRLRWLLLRLKSKLLGAKR